MKFGNWTVKDGRIEFNGPKKFVIEKAALAELSTPEDSDEELYKSIIIASTDDSLNDDDIYDLNFAFVYAMAQADINFDYEIFDKTLDYQYETLSDDEDGIHQGIPHASENEADLEQQRKEALTERD